jgi:hypothetical protein
MEWDKGGVEWVKVREGGIGVSWVKLRGEMRRV